MLKLKYYMLFLLLVSISLGERKVNHFYGDLLYEVPPKFKKIMDNAVVYEAETGTWPNKEYLESRGIGFGSTFWKYELVTNDKKEFVVKATVRSGNIIKIAGRDVDIEPGDFISISSSGLVRTNNIWPKQSSLDLFCQNAEIVPKKK